MHILTHLLCGWSLAELAGTRKPMAPRDRALVSWACVAPDLDGAGMLVDTARRLLGLTPTDYYESWHHLYGHGAPAAVLVMLIVHAVACERLRTAALALLAFHLHLLGDLVGSRGAGPLDLWGIAYLAPLSPQPLWVWSGQWPLTSWQNTTFTLALLWLAAIWALRRGYSPVSLFSRRADTAVVGALRRRFGGAGA